MKYKPKTKQFAHQRHFLIWMWRKTRGTGVGSKGGGLFGDPGVGKSKAILDFIKALHLNEEAYRVLIICPINALQVWPAQIARHFGDEDEYFLDMPEGRIVDKASQVWEISMDKALMMPKIHFLMLNFAAIIKRDKEWKIMKAIEAYDPDVLVVDESHHIKRSSTKQFKAVYHISKLHQFLPKVIVATGTPIGSSYLDLYAQLKVVDERIWGGISWTRFRQQYAIWGGPSGYQLRGYQRLDELEDQYKPHIVSARKEDIDDMPTVTDQIIPVDWPPAAGSTYDLFSQDGLVVHRGHLIDAPIVLTKLLRQQEMCGGWVHDENGVVVEIHRAKLEAYDELVTDILTSGHNVVVFARFLAEIRALEEVSRRRAKWVETIRGGVSAWDRTRIVSSFQRTPDPGVLVVQIGSAEALDGIQQACSYGIFYSVDFSLIHWNQARGRIDRTGQRDPVTFYHLQMKGSIDREVMKALRQKKSIEKIVMDHPEILISRRLQ